MLLGSLERDRAYSGVAPLAKNTGSQEHATGSASRRHGFTAQPATLLAAMLWDVRPISNAPVFIEFAPYPWSTAHASPGTVPIGLCVESKRGIGIQAE
ncbi:hypothetical protein PG985_003610 [Apiospora marii]|uniref:uncharacterized protein n=1 Tax=Apiospora marii TaxID=335849 RepID=UPI003130F8AB